MRIPAIAFAALLPIAAHGQDVRKPEPISDGAIVTRPIPPAREAGQLGCFAVSTRAGDQLRIDLQPSGFGGSVTLARGALCDAAATQRRALWRAGAQPGPIAFTAAGGRYLILVDGDARTAAGQYRLHLTIGAEAAGPPPDIADMRSAAPSPAAPDGLQAARKALMQAQVARRRVALAEARAARERAEAERQRQAELERVRQRQRQAELAAQRASQPNTAAIIAGAFIQGFTQQSVQSNQSAATTNYYNTQIRSIQAEMAARNAQENVQRARSDQQRRQAEAALAAAQQQLRNARQQEAYATRYIPPGAAPPVNAGRADAAGSAGRSSPASTASSSGADTGSSGRSSGRTLSVRRMCPSEFEPPPPAPQASSFVPSPRPSPLAPYDHCGGSRDRSSPCAIQEDAKPTAESLRRAAAQDAYYAAVAEADRRDAAARERIRKAHEEAMSAWRTREAAKRKQCEAGQ